MNETFGRYLKQLRMGKGLTLTQCAARLDLDSANLSKIENGKRTFDEKRLQLVAKEFNVNLNILKLEYFSDKIANDIYKSKCNINILLLAEKKVKYLKNNSNV